MNRPIEDHDELAFIFSDEKYPGNTQATKTKTLILSIIDVSRPYEATDKE
jgi:hypothetical protein